MTPQYHFARRTGDPFTGAVVFVPPTLEIGDAVTISPNKRCNDRSYTTDVWKIAAINAGHVMMQMIGPRVRDYCKVIVVLRNEHDFYPAADFAAALEGAT